MSTNEKAAALWSREQAYILRKEKREKRQNKLKKKTIQKQDRKQTNNRSHSMLSMFPVVVEEKEEEEEINLFMFSEAGLMEHRKKIQGALMVQRCW